MTAMFPTIAVAILALRVVPIATYFLGFWRAVPRDRAIRRARTAVELANACTGIVLFVVPGPKVEEVRREILADEQRRVETVLVGGSIALAAWTQLFVSSETEPASRLSGQTLALLFLGAGVLLVVPLLFRTEGRLVTSWYRGLATYTGFGLVVLSLTSAAVDLLNGWYDLVAVVVALLLLAREALELRDALVELRRYADFPAAVRTLSPPHTGRTAEPPAAGSGGRSADGA